MIEYVIAQNPDDRILKKASKILADGGLVCLPTDTNWVVTADPLSKHGIEKLYRFKHAEADKHFSVLCDAISTAAAIAEIGDSTFRMLRGRVPGNFTFIFKARKSIRKKLSASKRDQEIGVRFPPAYSCSGSSRSTTGPALFEHRPGCWGSRTGDNASTATSSKKPSPMTSPGTRPRRFDSRGGTIVSLVNGGDPILGRAPGAGRTLGTAGRHGADRDSSHRPSSPKRRTLSSWRPGRKPAQSYHQKPSDSRQACQGEPSKDSSTASGVSA